MKTNDGAINKMCEIIKKGKYILLIVLGIYVVCCQMYHLKSNNCQSTKENSMNMENTKGYFFEMSSEDVDNIRINIESVKIGDDAITVIGLLGKPTHDKKLVDKKGVYIARVLSYYIKKWDNNLVNEKKDKLVRLEFDSNEQLIRIVSNVENINNKP